MDKFRPKFYYAKKSSTPRAGRVGERDKLRRESRTNFTVGQTLTKTEPTERDNLKKLRARRRKIIRLLRSSSLAIVCLLVFLRFFVFKTEVFFVKTVTSPDINLYQQTIGEYFNQQPFERLSFNTDKNHLERFIQTKHPEVLRITTIQTGFLQPTRFELELRQPLATLVLNQKRYYVDSAGVPFADNFLTAPTLEITDQSGIKESGELSQQIVSGRFLQFIGRAIALAKEKGYIVTGATIPTGTIHQVDFQVEGHELFVKMTIDQDVAKQVEDMARALNYVKNSGLSLQYLDVRVENKAFYK